MAKFKVGDIVCFDKRGRERPCLVRIKRIEGPVVHGVTADGVGKARFQTSVALASMSEVAGYQATESHPSLLDEVKPILEDRQAQYGDARPDFERIAKLWSALVGVEIKVEQVPLMMQALKLSRAWTHYKRDNQVDLVGYAVKYEEVANAT